MHLQCCPIGPQPYLSWQSCSILVKLLLMSLDNISITNSGAEPTHRGLSHDPVHLRWRAVTKVQQYWVEVVYYKTKPIAMQPNSSPREVAIGCDVEHNGD